jgi:hypothetical protein
LRDENLERDIIKTVEFVEEEVKVYNFSVDKVEAYFSNGILSHNMAMPVPPPGTLCPDGTYVAPGKPCPQTSDTAGAKATSSTTASMSACPDGTYVAMGMPCPTSGVSTAAVLTGASSNGLYKAGNAKEAAAMAAVTGK